MTSKDKREAFGLWALAFLCALHYLASSWDGVFLSVIGYGAGFFLARALNETR